MNMIDKVFGIIIKLLTYVDNINALSGNKFTPWLLKKLGVTQTTTKRKKTQTTTAKTRKKVTKVD